jgi:type IV secretion system protein VirD4
MEFRLRNEINGAAREVDSGIQGTQPSYQLAAADIEKRDRHFGWKRWTIIALWGAFVLWTGWGTVSDLFRLIGGARPSNPFVAAFNPPGALLSLNLWGCASALLVALVVANPMGWLNGKRLVIACTAFAAMMGRLTAGILVGALAYSQLLDPAVLFLVTPLVLVAGGSVVIVVLFFILAVAFSVLVGVPVMLFNQIFTFERALTIYRYQSNSLAGWISRAVLWLRNIATPEGAPDDSKGARFATLREIKALHRPDDPAAMAFGHVGTPLMLKTEKHILVMASTRSGKGVTLIIPHLLRYAGSAFVLDPKAENAKAAYRRRRQLNDRVHVLDPFGITGLPRARFNPLSRFTPANMEAESKSLASALFLISDGKRDHWNASGQQLVAALILFVYVSKAIPKAKKDLGMVRKLLLGRIKETLEEMVTLHDVADGLLRDLAKSFLITPPNELGSIVSTAQRETEILDNPNIVACLSATGPGEEVDFKAWKHGTMSVFLCLSAPKFPTFNRWLRLILTSALDEMTDTLHPPPLPVCFMLDELATLGHLQAVENAVGLAAGYGIQLVSVFQDIGQMKDLYAKRWASFIGNSGVRALFNLDDYETAEYWSKFIGGRLHETRNQQQNIYGMTSGENVGEAVRPLVTPDQLMLNFASGKMLVLAQGAHPVITDRVAYFQDQGLAGLWDDPRAAIGTAPREAKAVFAARPAPQASAPAPSEQASSPRSPSPQATGGYTWVPPITATYAPQPDTQRVNVPPVSSDDPQHDAYLKAWEARRQHNSGGRAEDAPPEPTAAGRSKRSPTSSFRGFPGPTPPPRER